MNQWMTRPFEYPDVPMDRGKVLWEEDLERMNGKWARYLDSDGMASLTARCPAISTRQQPILPEVLVT